MKRVKMIVAYDGTNYCGWQFQANGLTIEEVLNRALSGLLKEEVAVIGASRTDSGVHAEGNVAVFDTDNRMPADKICFALNQRLPEDIRILRSEKVPPDYHPRKQNCVKTYEYKILNRRIDMPTQRLYAYFCYFPLDVEKMKEGAKYLVGEHDFQSFCSARSQAEETVRTIYSLDLRREGDMITLRISGSGFLYNMVRIIAGTLMKVGMGVYPPEHVEEILEARDRSAAGPKAAAKGLTLIGLDYETQLRPSIAGENRHWKYCLYQQEVEEHRRAYLVIEDCENGEFDRLFLRMVHQAVRNGARRVYVCDCGRSSREEAAAGRQDEVVAVRGETAGKREETAAVRGETAGKREETVAVRGETAGKPEETAGNRVAAIESRIAEGKAYGYYQARRLSDTEYPTGASGIHAWFLVEDDYLDRKSAGEGEKLQK